MDSFDTDYIFTNNKNVGQYDQNAIPSQIIPYSYPGNLINQNEISVELNETSSSGTNYVLNDMKMLANMVHMWCSEVMACYRYPASLLDQFEILIDSSC